MPEQIERSIDNLITSFSKENLTDYLMLKDDFNFYTKRHYGYEEDMFDEIYEVAEKDLRNGITLKIFTIKTKGELTERSSKKKQYELAKKILKSLLIQAGIFVFYDEIGNFRFSLVYSTFSGTKREYSYYKRYTYYVAKGKPYRTFKKALLDVKFETLEDLINAFSTQPLTREFYTEIQNWYAWALEYAWFPGGKLEENLIRLLTRIIFVWFLKERKLVPEEIFEFEFLKDIVKDFGREDYYYNAILQNLFFATLNREAKERRFAEDLGFIRNRGNFGVKSLFRYERYISIPEDKFVKIFERVPFINGGLFECLDDDSNYVDGFTRKEDKRARLPDFLFFSKERDEDLSSFYGEEKRTKVRGLIDILKDYNFTADENTPIDIEVSLDPELLGHIFENLLASYNPETQTSARKATGSYYTPKEIVEFMVEESLIEYLKTKTEIEEEKIREILSYKEEVNLSDKEKELILYAIDSLKVIDPAVGSGAFPMGMVHKLVYILNRIDPDNKLWYELQYNKALNEMERVLKIKDKAEREERLKELNDNFDESINYPDYARKLYIIENSIYGVDIQPIAIQICKLRFFLSLLIDQKIDESKENYGIKPLPHLETKFVCANTLIGLDKPKQINMGEYLLEELKTQLKDLYKRHFNIKTRTEKKRLQEKAQELRNKIKEALINDSWKTYEAEKIANFDIFSQTATADWFDPEWMLGVEDRFDIVIGNPPYIQLQNAFNNKIKYADLYKDQNYETFKRTGDIYCLFYEKGLKLLKPKGHLCYITSNKWMRAGYGEALRGFFTKYNPKLLIDLGPNVFERSTVDTCIILIQNADNENKLKAVTINEIKKDSINISEYVKNYSVILNKLSKDAWFIGSQAERDLKEKIEYIGKPLKDWDIKIYYGIKTGLNEAFIITTEKRSEILANCKTEEERKRTEAIIKPILRGRDIKRYYYEWAGLWVILAKFGFYKEAYLYPTVVSHLKKFEEKLKNRGQCKYTRQGNIISKDFSGQHHWLELDNNPTDVYLSEFEKEKVVWGNISYNSEFCLVERGIFINTPANFITSEETSIKYLIAVMNSKIFDWQFKQVGIFLGYAYEWKKQYVELVKLPPITPFNEPIVRQIEELVDIIIQVKKQNKNADTTEWEKEIDRLVYLLYDLTEEEIKIIERK